jgi:hypothetical protein
MEMILFVLIISGIFTSSNVYVSVALIAAAVIIFAIDKITEVKVSNRSSTTDDE